MGCKVEPRRQRKSLNQVPEMGIVNKLYPEKGKK